MQDAHPIRIDRYPSGLGELVLSIALISEPEPPEASQRPWTTRRSSRSSTGAPRGLRALRGAVTAEGSKRNTTVHCACRRLREVGHSMSLHRGRDHFGIAAGSEEPPSALHLPVFRI